VNSPFVLSTVGGDPDTVREVIDQAAAIEEHLPLVRHIVFQVAVHFPRHVDREELARAGALGLVEAAQRYEESRGVPFERFAAQRIRGAILDAVRAADWAPRSLRTMARSLEQTSAKLLVDLGRAPTSDEVAAAMSTTPEQLARLQGKIHRSVVLTLDHSAADAEDDATLGDLLTDADSLEPSEELEARELLAYLRDAVRLLPERHRLVVIGYFLEGKTSADLARFLGVTESRVSQLRSESLEMLRDAIESQYAADDDAEPATTRAAKRKAAFAAEVAAGSDWRDRLSAAPVS
jgi:RNA polymerase sigma factor FliA